MPLIRPDTLPLGPEEVAAIRAELTEAFQFRVVEQEGLRCLFIRSDKDDPDPINDLEAALNEVPDWAIGEPSDVVLLGSQQRYHIPKSATQPILERRRRIDDAALHALRGGLDPHYGCGLHRVPGDPANVLRLGLRVPRRTIKEVDDPDLNRLAKSVGPSLDANELRHVRIAYLVAEQDHVRLRGVDVVADLAPRWQAVQRTPKPAPSPPASPPPQAEPAPPPPPAARPRPKRTIRVRPVVELEQHLDSIGVEEKEQALLESAGHTLDARLVESGYDVVRRVEHDGTVFALAAERASAYPRRVLVHTLHRCDRGDADHLLKLVREVDADLLVCVCVDATDAARRRLLATKVKLLDPREAGTFRL